MGRWPRRSIMFSSALFLPTGSPVLGCGPEEITASAVKATNASFDAAMRNVAA